MKKRIILTLKSMIAVFLVLAAACQPVSDEAYYSALKATSNAPFDTGNSSSDTSMSQEAETVLYNETADIENNSDNTEISDTAAVITEIIPENPADSQPLYNSPTAIGAPFGLCYNLTDGVMLYGKNIDEKMYPASITKLLTALVALQYAPEDFVFNVGNEIWQIEPGSSIAPLSIGQKLDLNAILTALLIPSGNDAALSIAVNIARYNAENADNMTHDELVSYFVGLMNEYVQTIGLENSHFANPDGYHHDNHFSTLRDLLKICVASAENPVVSDICAQFQPTVTFISGETVTWISHLPLINQEEWGIKGLKTGYTDESLFSFAALAELNGKQYIAIVSGCPSANERIEDTKKLLAIARNGFYENSVTDYLENDFG